MAKSDDIESQNDVIHSFQINDILCLE